MNSNPLASCRLCKTGTMRTVELERVFTPPAGRCVVRTLAARCDHCARETVLASQMAENIERLLERKALYGTNLLGEEIFAFRRRYGLTQQAASRIFGKGKIAFSRYETEVSFPDSSTTKLLRLAMRFPAVLKFLADEEQVEIPLWADRCTAAGGPPSSATVTAMEEGLCL